MSFIRKDKAYSSNVWSVMSDASLIYKCVQYLLNSLSWKAVGYTVSNLFEMFAVDMW